MFSAQHENINKMYQYIFEHAIFIVVPGTSRGIITKQVAILAQTQDMLIFRAIGLDGYKNYISHRALY